MIDLDKIKKQKNIQELIEFSIINLDKPIGPTSFTIDLEIKKLFDVQRTGHFGTLDPGVGGVLPVALGRACRLAEYFAKQDKTYVGIMRLHSEVKDDELARAVKQFVGTIKQRPPVRSSIRRVERPRDVYEFTILEREGNDVLFLARVQAGTYIRTLVHDLGKLVGGANMLELRRIQASIFSEKESVTIYELEEAVKRYHEGNEKILRELLIPGEVVATLLPTVEIKSEHVGQCLRGSPVFAAFLKKKASIEEGQRCCALSKGTFIGCYRALNKNDIFATPEFVLN